MIKLKCDIEMILKMHVNRASLINVGLKIKLIKHLSQTQTIQTLETFNNDFWKFPFMHSSFLKKNIYFDNECRK